MRSVPEGARTSSVSACHATARSNVTKGADGSSGVPSNKRMQLTDPPCHDPGGGNHTAWVHWTVPGFVHLRRILLQARAAPGGPQLMHNVMPTRT